MESHPRESKLVSRLDSDNPMAQPCQPRRVRSSPRTDIKHATRGAGYQMQYSQMFLSEGNAFVTLDKLFSFLRIAFSTCNHGPSLRDTVILAGFSGRFACCLFSAISKCHTLSRTIAQRSRVYLTAVAYTLLMLITCIKLW